MKRIRKPLKGSSILCRSGAFKEANDLMLKNRKIFDDLFLLTLKAPLYRCAGKCRTAYYLLIRLFYFDVLSRQAYRYFLTFLEKGLWNMGITTIFILIWIGYNTLRFRRRGDRRRRMKVVCDPEIAAYFKVDPRILQAVKRRRSVTGLINDHSEVQFRG